MTKNIETRLKPSYSQPHNIRCDTGNEALDYCLRMKEHRRQKYDKSKWSKRYYGKE